MKGYMLTTYTVNRTGNTADAATEYSLCPAQQDCLITVFCSLVAPGLTLGSTTLAAPSCSIRIFSVISAIRQGLTYTFCLCEYTKVEMKLSL